MHSNTSKLRGLNQLRCTRVPSKILFLCISACLFTMRLLAGQNPDATGQVQGTAFIQDSNGQSYIAKAKVTLNGPAIMEVETDEDGKFEFRDVPPGTYIVEAAVPGLLGSQNVTVDADKVAKISLELKPAAVQDSVTVTANANETETTSASPSGTVTASTLRNTPNIDDRAESILPTLPGVVRGPDGRINLKGARSTQSGALVNSANATDPATGSPGFAVPIDVVSSVHVISNPYDPQYGKLTGAVATIETKTSDFEKFHFSVQNFIPRIRVRDDTIFGIGAATPRVTFTGPIWADHIAVTQSVGIPICADSRKQSPAISAGYNTGKLQFLHPVRFQSDSQTDRDNFPFGIPATPAVHGFEHIHATAIHVRLSPARLSVVWTAPVSHGK